MRLAICVLLLSSNLTAALNYTANSTDKADCGSPTTLDDLGTSAPFTIIGWLKPSSVTVTSLISAKQNGTAEGWRFFVTLNGGLQFVVNGVANWTYISSNSIIANTTWQYVAATFNSAGAANEAIQLYRGTLTTAAAETTYSSRTDTTAKTTENAQNLYIGNHTGSSSNSNAGDIAIVGIWPSELTLNEIIAQQFMTRPVKAGSVGFWHLGHNGTTSVVDWSGNANNCATLTGLVQAAHVPLPAPFARNRNPFWRSPIDIAGEWLRGFLEA